MDLNKMKEQRAKLIHDARDIYETAEKENRQVTKEQREQFDKLMDDAQNIKLNIDRLTVLAEEERKMTETSGRQTAIQRSDGETSRSTEKTGPEKMGKVELRRSIAGESRDIVWTETEEKIKYQDTFRRYLIGGANALVGMETRALQKDDDTAGGYLSAPEQFQAELIQSLDNLVFMRQIGRVLPAITSAESLGSPSLDNDPADPTWTGELLIGSEDSTMTFGKRNLTPHPLAQYIKVSNTLLRRSSLSADSIVRDRLSYKCAVVEENAFLNGSGSNQPLGVFTASNDGVTTSQDVSTGNTASSIMFDGLKEALYGLPAQYRRNLNWIFHRDGIKQISKLKDGEGRYIWQQSVTIDKPDTILNHPVRESEYAPNTFSANQYVGIVGDFRYYWIVDALTITIQVLKELYAATNQTGYISRLECDGMPVLASAFRRVKLAAS